MSLHEGASVSFRSLQATWPNKMDAKAAILWSSLAKLFDIQGHTGIKWQSRASNSGSLNPATILLLTTLLALTAGRKRLIKTSPNCCNFNLPLNACNVFKFFIITHSRYLVCYLTHSINIRSEYFHSNNCNSSFFFLFSHSNTHFHERKTDFILPSFLKVKIEAT